MISPAAYCQGPNDPTPQERLLLMNEDGWEQLIEDCVRQLKCEGRYIEVIRFGGAGDKGRDVCGYKVSPPSAGEWDLYQAKYYAHALSPSEFAPELAKFLLHVYARTYPCPQYYYLCALKIGPKLNELILNPESMRTWICEEWERNFVIRSLGQPMVGEFATFVSNFSYDIIKRLPPADLLSIHSRNAELHWRRFGVLAQRSPNPPIPSGLDYIEQNYVQALFNVYQEVAGHDITSMDDIPRDYVKHFQAQRRLFYSAEGLNRFSRDKLPGAFDELLEQIDLGVASIVAAPHDSGMSRLQQTLIVANGLQVTSNPLSARLVSGDLQGGCHHLANQQRLHWVDNNED